MTEGNKPDKHKKSSRKPKLSNEPIDNDWRDPSKPRNPEHDVIVDGWRRRSDGIFEKVEDTELDSDNETEDGE